MSSFDIKNEEVEKVKKNLMISKEGEQKNSKNKNKNYLLTMDIKLQTGSKTIDIFKGDKSEEIAYEFCKKNNLDFQVMRYLSKKIDQAVDKYMLNFSNKENISSNRPKRPLSSSKRNNDVVYNNQKINYGEYLYEKGKSQLQKTKLKLTRIKKENEEIKNNELTFKPKLYKSKSCKNVCGVISQDKFPTKKKEETIQTPQFSFRPQINKNSRTRIKTKFPERLKKYTESLKVNENPIKDDLVDSKTGQKFFHPKLVSKNNSKINRRNVFQINYNYASYYKRDKEELSQLNYEKFNKTNLVPNDTEKIFTEKKLSSFKYIFELLDSDEDGIITPVNINKKALGEKIESILSPVLTQIVAQKAVIEEGDFIQAMDVLFSAMTIEERGEILNVRKNIKKKVNDVKVISEYHKERMLRKAMSAEGRFGKFEY